MLPESGNVEFSITVINGFALVVKTPSISGHISSTVSNFVDAVV